jgi:hypothetical protein
MISDGKFKATKQDEMAGKALYCQGNLKSNGIPPELSRRAQGDSNKKRKVSSGSAEIHTQRGTTMQQPKNGDTGSQKKSKCDHTSASKPNGSGGRNTRNSSGGRSSTAGKSGGSSGKKSQASSGGGTSNRGSRKANGGSGTRSSKQPKIKVEPGDPVAKELTFDPLDDDRMCKLFSLNYKSKTFAKDEKAMVPFQTVCSSLSSFPYGPWFVKTDSDGKDVKPNAFISLHREVYLNSTTLLGLRVVTEDADWLPESDYVIPPEHAKMLELLFKMYVPYQLFEDRLGFRKADAKGHVKFCNKLGEWFDAWTKKITAKAGFLYVRGYGAEVKHVKKDSDKTGCVIYDHFVLHRMISNKTDYCDLTEEDSGDEAKSGQVGGDPEYVYSTEGSGDDDLDEEDDCTEESEAGFDLEAEVDKGDY